MGRAGERKEGKGTGEEGGEERRGIGEEGRGEGGPDTKAVLNLCSESRFWTRL